MEGKKARTSEAILDARDQGSTRTLALRMGSDPVTGIGRAREDYFGAEQIGTRSSFLEKRRDAWPNDLAKRCWISHADVNAEKVGPQTRPRNS